jgi:hypothetical protein
MSDSSDLEEGQYDEASETDSEASSSLKAALPVGKFSKKFTPESLPTSGQEYLCQVRHQASSLKHPAVPEITEKSLEADYPLNVGNFEPISVTKDQVDSATMLFTSHPKIPNSIESFKMALKGDLSRLLFVDPASLKPSQISDLRVAAKESQYCEFIIIVATCFGQSDLISIQ